MIIYDEDELKDIVEDILKETDDDVIEDFKKERLWISLEFL